MSLINVKNANGKIVARVEYNHNLDKWDGNNYCRGVGRHLGLTRLRNGNYALIHGTQWQGEEDSAEEIMRDDALQQWCDGGEPAGFPELEAMAEKLEQK